MAGNAHKNLLYRLARLYGVQSSYYDVFLRRRKIVPPESIAAILRSLGAPLANIEDASAAFRQKQQEMCRRPIDPVIVCWDGKPAVSEIRLPADSPVKSLGYQIRTESGDVIQRRWISAENPVSKSIEIEGAIYVSHSFILPAGLPYGYHRLTVEFPGSIEKSLVISSPLKAHEGSNGRQWGVFLPLYALKTGAHWGCGDYSDLTRMMNWVKDMGGNAVATLPLLPPVDSDSTDYSPYRPSSRLLWNEFYVDLNNAPELANCLTAQEIINSPSFQTKVSDLQTMPLVDYKRQMALKRQILEQLSECLFKNPSTRLAALLDFIKKHPEVEEYARFNAGGNEEVRRYYLYAQWLAHQQVKDVSDTARKNGMALYLDLPLGVHPAGYDHMRFRESFLANVKAGAPSDTVFTCGQNWQCPPLHPEVIRGQGYEHVIAYIRHHMEYAGILRIDHMMGLHRLFCIPDGMEPGQGAYLHYRAEEFYAILSLESNRHKTMIVGEDLGNVPRYVRPSMKRHGLNGMYVLRYELADDIRRGIRQAPRDAAASINTHDMPPFASFWHGIDIDERVRLCVLDKAHAQAEWDSLPNVKKALAAILRQDGWLGASTDTDLDILKACLLFLAASQARLVLVNLEDLWLETSPQNVPGTLNEYPNWQHKMKMSFEEFRQSPQVVNTLKSIARLRGGSLASENG